MHPDLAQTQLTVLTQSNDSATAKHTARNPRIRPIYASKFWISAERCDK